MDDKYIVNASDLTGIADAIREKSDTTEPLVFPNGFASTISNIDTDSFYEKGYVDGYSAGERESGGEYWTYVNSGSNLFEGTNFPENYTINLNIQQPRSLFCMFKGSNITKIILKGNVKSSVISWREVCRSCSQLTIFDATDFNCVIKDAISAFPDCYKLTDIIGTLDLSESANNSNMFTHDAKLVEVRFVEDSIKLDIGFTYCSKLSNETIKSIINGLADMTGETAKIITFHSDVAAKLTTDQLTTIMDKNWNIG